MSIYLQIIPQKTILADTAKIAVKARNHLYFDIKRIT